MSKITLGQRKFPTLGLRSQQPKNYVGPTLSCYLGCYRTRLYVIYEPNFQILVALFTTFRMQNEDNTIFVCGCFRTI